MATTFQVKTENQFHRMPAVLDRYGVSVPTIYRWVSQGLFPAPVPIGPNTRAWRESDLRAFDADPVAWREEHMYEATA